MTSVLSSRLHPAAQHAAGSPVGPSPARWQSEAPVVMPRKGLQLPSQLTFENWLSIGQRLSELYTSSAWCLGDWLAYGQAAYGGRYRTAIEHSSLDYQTLRNYAWVARQLPMSRRRDTLTFGHHAEVAARPEAEQDFWLRKAEENKWPVKQLRRQIRTSLSVRSAGNDMQPLKGSRTRSPRLAQPRLLIRPAPSQLDNWRAAAAHAGLSVDAWAAAALDRTAQYELGQPAKHGK
jgi:hypothetical protein